MSALFLKVSNLFARDEIDEINSDLVSVMKKEYPRRPPTNENLYDYFMNRVRQNLHIVLCFSPVGRNSEIELWSFLPLFQDALLTGSADGPRMP